jgi:hypothetical protein
LLKHNHEYSVKTYGVTEPQKVFEICCEEVNPVQYQVGEKYWMQVLNSRLGVVKYKNNPNPLCIVQPVMSLAYSKKCLISQQFRTSQGNTSILKCLSSFDEQNKVLVTFGCMGNKHNLVLCKFLPQMSDLITVLKQDVASMNIADVVIRDTIVMMVTKEGEVTRFYPYDPALFELQLEKMVRGCDICFHYK